MENKYKVGDLVQVKSFEELKEEFDIKHDIDYYETHAYEDLFEDDCVCFTSPMIKFCDRIAKIINLDGDDKYALEGLPYLTFTESMLKPVELETCSFKLNSDGLTLNWTDEVTTKSYPIEDLKKLEERKMEDIELLNMYEEKGLSRINELFKKEVETTYETNEFVAKFKAIKNVYNKACEELYKTQREKFNDNKPFPIMKNYCPSNCDYELNDDYYNIVSVDVNHKYDKLRTEFKNKVEECNMQIRLIQQTSNSYEDIMKVLKLYGVVDDNGKVVTYEPTIVEEKKEEEVKPKRKYTKRKQVNEDNRK